MSFKRVKYLTCIHKTFKFCCHRRKWYVLSSKYKLFEALLNCQSMVSHYLVELSLSRAAAKKRVKAYFHWKDADRIIFLVLFVRNEKFKYFQCIFWCLFVNNTSSSGHRRLLCLPPVSGPWVISIEFQFEKEVLPQWIQTNIDTRISTWWRLGRPSSSWRPPCPAQARWCDCQPPRPFAQVNQRQSNKLNQQQKHFLLLNHSDHQHLGPLLGADPVPGGKAVLLCKLIDLRIVHLHIAGSSYLV